MYEGEMVIDLWNGLEEKFKWIVDGKEKMEDDIKIFSIVEWMDKN